LEKAISDLEHGNVNHELLTRSVKLLKNPGEYHNTNDRKRRLGLAAGARKGDVIDKMNNNRLRTQKLCYLVSNRYYQCSTLMPGM
jgi:hypothetical protein